MRQAVHGSRRGLLGQLVLAALVLAGGQASAAEPGTDRPWLDPQKRIGQFVFDGFTSEDGLPSSSLLYLHQTRDGYLWITSFNGLVRFDGVTFTLFGRSTTDAFENNAVENLVEDREGVLWVGVQGQGLVAYDRGTFRFDPETQRFAPFIKSLYVDDANLIWIGTQGDGVFTFDGKRFRAFDPGPALRQVIVLAMRETSDGTLWFATEGRGVVSHRAGKLRSYTTADGLPSDLVNDLFVDSGGTLWASTIQGLARLREGRFEVVPETLGFDAFRMVEDGSGSLWLAAKGALFRIDPRTGRVESYGPNEGSPVHYLYQLCLDREGNLWITACRGGLCRLGDAILVLFGAPVASPDDPVRAAACALEMQREMAAVNARNREKGLPEVEMVIGIHTGEAVVGNIGSARRAKYGVVGRSINFASRIESYTVGGQVLISEATRAALGDLAELGDAIEVHPKGLRTVTIHDLTGLGGSYGLRLERRRRTRSPPLAKALPCRFVVLEGKDARGKERTGTVVALSADGREATVRSDEGARAFSDLRLSLDACRSAEVYAKVLGEATVDGAFAVRFTAIPEEANRLLEAAAGAATDGPPDPA